MAYNTYSTVCYSPYTIGMGTNGQVHTRKHNLLKRGMTTGSDLLDKKFNINARYVLLADAMDCSSSASQPSRRDSGSVNHFPTAASPTKNIRSHCSTCRRRLSISTSVGAHSTFLNNAKQSICCQGWFTDTVHSYLIQCIGNCAFLSDSVRRQQHTSREVHFTTSWV